MKKSIKHNFFNFLLFGFTLILSSRVCLLGMKIGRNIVCTLLLTGKQEWSIGYVANCKRKSNYAVSVTLLILAYGAYLVTSLHFSDVNK